MSSYFKLTLKSFFYQIIFIPLYLTLDSKILNEILLQEQNKYRLLHNSRNLSLDNKIIKDASTYAESLTKNSELIFEPSGIYYNTDEKYGENIFYCNKKTCKDQNVTLAVTTWYEESLNYNYDTNEGIEGTHNFTQMIWKNTKKIGCGLGEKNDESYVIVCFYYPKGNIVNEYKDNVLKGNNTIKEDNAEEYNNIYEDYDEYINNNKYLGLNKYYFLLIIFAVLVEFM